MAVSQEMLIALEEETKSLQLLDKQETCRFIIGQYFVKKRLESSPDSVEDFQP